MKTFILCVGAQKAGTSWLRDYFEQRPDVQMGFKKEYHVFDCRTMPSAEGYKTRLLQKAEKARQKRADAETQWAVRVQSFIEDPNLYYDYFAGLLSDEATLASGDFTPSYSGLSADTLREIKLNFEARGIAVKPIFLMREPVDRLRSIVKMQLRKRDIAPTRQKELAQMRKRCGGVGDQVRSNYKHTVTALEEVFGLDVFIGFYESLFNDDTLSKICSFVGLEPKPGDYGVRKNASEQSDDVTAADLALFASAYAEQYEFCRERFGSDFIDSIWPQKLDAQTGAAA